VLRREGRELRVYQRLGFPGPLADRHYVILIHDLPPQGHDGHEIRWRLAPDEPPPASGNRVLVPTVFTGSWALRPAGDGATAARYSVHVDPGGRVPGWLAGPAIERYVVRVMEAVRQRVRGIDGPGIDCPLLPDSGRSD
jgi:hypothetical protein